VAVVVVKWNFPFFLACGKVAPAIAAGCTMILKPAEQTPLSSIYLGSLIREVRNGIVVVVFQLSSLHRLIIRFSRVELQTMDFCHQGTEKENII